MQNLELIAFFVLALPLAIFIHEVGHAIFGQRAGLRVLAVVIGTGRPLFVHRFRGTLVCLMSRPWLTGMAICISRGFRTPPRALAAFAIGGPAASLFSGVLLLPVLALTDSQSVSMFIFLSIALGLTNAFPFRARVGPAILRSDGMLAIGALRGTNDRDAMLGQSLASARFVLELFQKLNDKEGVANLTAMLGLAQLSVCDYDSAAETLSDDVLDLTYAKDQTLIARALLVAAVEPRFAPEVIAYAKAELGEDLEAVALLAVAEADAAVARQDPAAEDVVLAAFEMAKRSEFPQLLTAVELCAMRARPSADPWATGQKIRALRGGAKPSLHLDFDTWLTIAEQLHAAGDHTRALLAFDEADKRMRQIASGIGDQRAREAFLRAKSTVLAKIAPIKPFDKPIERSTYRTFSNGCAIGALLAYLLFAIVVLRYDGDALELFSAAVVLSLLGLTTALIGGFQTTTFKHVRAPLLINAALVAAPFFLAAIR